MKCSNPFTPGGGVAYPCGQCHPCRINRRREWTHRMLLEGALHKENAFVTLTYRDESLPLTATGLPTLVPAHLRGFLNRLRSTLAPARIRFFAVGEYGEISLRPHYHVVIFGYPHCHRLLLPRRAECCSVCATISSAWDMGNVLVGSFTPEAAQYTAGYTIKKMTSMDKLALSDGRVAEFSRMSNRPGIGHDAMWDLASTLLALDYAEADVPSALRWGNKLLPLGHYLKRTLRVMMGRPANAPLENIQALQAELSPVQKAAFENSLSLRQTLIELRAGDEASSLAKSAIRVRRKSL